MIGRSRVRIPAGAAGECFFSESTFCAVSFRYPFHSRVNAVARKRSWSFFERCRWQVTAKHACTAHTRLGIKWHCKLVRGCTVYTEHVPKQFRVQSEWGTESISWPAMTAHYVRHYCAQSRFQFPDPTSPPSRPRINTLGSSLAFEIRNPSTTTKTQVAYGYSHRACV